MLEWKYCEIKQIVIIEHIILQLTTEIEGRK